MPSTYPADYDTLALAYPRDIANAIVKMQHRLGKEQERAPDSVEDRLHTVENLLIDVLSRITLPITKGR